MDFEQHFSEKDVQSWDTPGHLSIVVQGPLFTSNIVDVANYCTHWKTLFPNSELILSASVTEFIVSNDMIRMPRELSGTDNNHGIIANALSALRAVCDRILFEQTGALPLPPITSGVTGTNNVNLQISAAQAGLAVAKGIYTLRVRSDFLFLNRNFLKQFERHSGLTRGWAARLNQRVLISWLYTLNPFSYEKFPFHYSDWFHFGLTADLVDLWTVPSMSFHDAIFFQNEINSGMENRYERRFYPRIAIEQHLTFNWAKRHFDDIVLRHRSDNTARDTSIDILVDNFILSDLEEAGAYFPKYEADFEHPEKRVQCITPNDWLTLAGLENHERPEFLRKCAAAASIRGRASFPRRFTAATLTPSDGFRSKGAITNSKSAGMLFFGPYTDMPSGLYRVTIALTAIAGAGCLHFRVTSNQGQRTLGEATFAAQSCPSSLSLDFAIEGLGADLVELICEMQDIDTVSVSEIVLDSLPDPTEDMP